jgi:hypothetical protein
MSGDDQSWRDVARRHMAEGRPAAALDLYQEEYLAARALPSTAGSLGSALLSEWAELGRSYPPALDALRRQRWAAVQRLRGTPGEAGQTGDPGERSRGLAALDDFAEVAAISARLDEPDYPVDLFADLDAHAPDVAEDCAAHARRLLVRAGRFDLARRHLGDPTEVVARVAAVFEQRLTRGFAHAPEDLRATLRARTVDDYLSGVREIIAVLEGVGEEALADDVRHQAVDAVPWAHVREDVEAALAG